MIDMSKSKSESLHKPTKEITEVLQKNIKLQEKWDSLTPLARNEWICWITIPKKEETRENHLKRMQEEVLSGKKRPCCWPGCPHRRESAKKWFK